MMETNELTRTLKTQLIPKAALIAYASEDDKNFFLEIRDINDRGNMAEGRPITQEFMNELVKGYSERHSSTPYGKVPVQPDLLRFTQGQRAVCMVQSPA
jgi:hypothetical protein